MKGVYHDVKLPGGAKLVDELFDSDEVIEWTGIQSTRHNPGGRLSNVFYFYWGCFVLFIASIITIIMLYSLLSEGSAFVVTFVLVFMAGWWWLAIAGMRLQYLEMKADSFTKYIITDKRVIFARMHPRIRLVWVSHKDILAVTYYKNKDNSVDIIFRPSRICFPRPWMLSVPWRWGGLDCGFYGLSDGDEVYWMINSHINRAQGKPAAQTSHPR